MYATSLRAFLHPSVESHPFDEEKYVERNKDFCVGRDADLT
jgi:hypothetical protein